MIRLQAVEPSTRVGVASPTEKVKHVEYSPQKREKMREFSLLNATMVYHQPFQKSDKLQVYKLCYG